MTIGTRKNDMSQNIILFVLLVCWRGGAANAFVGPTNNYQRGQIPATKQTSMFASFVPGESCSGEKITVVGATGYIGKAVVKESLRRGYPTTAVVRPGSNADESIFAHSERDGTNTVYEPVVTNGLPGKKVVSSPSTPSLFIERFDVSDEALCHFEDGSVDVVVCCLASRNGTPRESFAIDYQASLNVAKAAKKAGARRFILLSAYCVKSAEQKDPHALQFQYAKKKLEVALADMSKEGDFSYVSVRPTAFFKSVSGQLETVQNGGPFIIFDLGGGKTASCNPISEADLAAALIDQVVDDAHQNTHWNLGGPDSPGLDKLDQAEMIAEVLGMEEPPALVKIPIGVLHFIVNSFQWLADVFRSDKLNDAAELARIVRYYAIEDMLTTDEAEKYGTMTTRQHYEYIAKFGQEYDPYTSAYGILKDRKRILDESSKVSTSNTKDDQFAMMESV